MSEKENKVVSLSGARDKEKAADKQDKTEAPVVYCSFCGRPNHMVLKMVQGPGVNICSECTMICLQYLILEDRVPSSEAQRVIDAFWRGFKK
ncbi:MAG: hypothetical protein ACD_20C00363G0010 [uncultured bacterium]|nr:MAG: hypothetical protein ACD_20C00363G0010 [uncultured bacterium]HBH18310.1 hypothetical protein [Cyanobacteria bacterium UBA9579]